jgi:Lar family restriction alleviation protein
MKNFGITSEYNDKLKPCPFCGADAWLTHVEFNDGDMWYNPNCSECNSMYGSNFEMKDEAIEAWNKRI